jgi:hypothetical protein
MSPAGLSSRPGISAEIHSRAGLPSLESSRRSSSIRLAAATGPRPFGRVAGTGSDRGTSAASWWTFLATIPAARAESSPRACSAISAASDSTGCPACSSTESCASPRS